MRHEIDLADEFATLIATKVVDILEERGLVIVNAPSQDTSERQVPPTLYTIDEVCERVKVSKPTLQRHRNRGYITPSYYVGRSPRFTEADIEKYLESFNY